MKTLVPTRWRGGRLLAAGLWVLFASGTVAADGLTAADVARLRQVTAAELSPDGRQVAYILSVPRRPFEEDNGPAWSELHVVDTRGSSRPFVTGKVNLRSIAWTPSGDGITFLAKRGDDPHAAVYLIPIAGGEARRLREHSSDITGYSWSPDGRQLAFLAAEEREKGKKKEQDQGFDQRVYEEDWRPVRVWIADRDAATEGEPRMLQLDGSASELHWSPDGAHLAVALAPTPLIDDHYMNRKLHIVGVADGQVQRRLDNSGKLGAVAWSPDGRHLAVIAAQDLHDPSPGRLMVAATAGGPLRDLLPEFAGQVEDLAWQNPDDLMYVACQGVGTVLGEVSVGSGAARIIAPAAGPVLQRLALSGDGSAAAFVADSRQHPAEVLYMKHGDHRPRRLTDSNPWLSTAALAPQEVITYRARDGLEIEGMLIRPLDEQPHQRYPLIVTVHGGPEAHFSDGWLTRYTNPGQVAAARGYMVFHPNYRGSTGRGVAFSKAGQNDYGGKEFDDLIDGIDFLIERGWVDGDKVGVTGGSYGGFAAAWCATYHSPRFAASVMFVGISDHVSKFGTTDIPAEMYQVHSRRWPWEDWDYFRERSPVYHFQKCRTPILIMHGAEDSRVPPSQSMELYRYLKTYGRVPVRLVLYPGEGHGNRKAAARLDYHLRLMRWMDHYLKGPGGEPPPRDLDYAAFKPADPDEDAAAGSGP